MNLKGYLKKSWFCILSLRPMKRKVIFISFGGRQYSADPRAISEKMHELHPEYELVWIIRPEYRDKICLPEYIRVVDIKNGLMNELSDACSFITTDPLEIGMNKRNGQFFVQTWHGDRGFKKCLYEAWPEGKRPIDIIDDSITDIAVAASDYGVDVYHNAFRYYGKITKFGMPRNDRLINPDIQNVAKIKDELHIPQDVKVLTYAPTFRDNKTEKQDAVIDIENTLLELESKTNNKWICLIRAHASSKGILTKGISDRIIDVSHISDMADVLSISDMLITDYSSCAGDFVLTNKPVVLAIFDQEDYKSNSRELRIDVDQTGYMVAKNQEELVRFIRTCSMSDYENADVKVKMYYNTVESGNAAQMVCEMIHQSYADRHRYLRKK